MKTLDILFSYFTCVTNTKPLKEVTLYYIVCLLKSPWLRELTEKIRNGMADKSMLPGVTFAGLYHTRCKQGRKEDGRPFLDVAIDIDHLDFTSSLKERLAADYFLNSVLIYTTISGAGLRLVVRVQGGTVENYGLYYDLISRYIQGVFGVGTDKACRDHSRLSFICADESYFFNPHGFVTAEALLRLLPPPPVINLAEYAGAIAKSVTRAAASKYRVSHFVNSVLKPSERLNRLPEVENRAFALLQAHGWKRVGNTDYWTRPGKPYGVSAIFNYYSKAGCRMFRNFSTNAPVFDVNRSYTPVEVINVLEFGGGDFKKCLRTLACQYLD